MKSLLLFLLSLSSAFAIEQADVVVVTANPAGVAAAVAAAKSGAKVIVLEESAHVGGIIAGGLTNTDIRKHGAVGGLYNEFKRRIVEHYTKTYGAESRQVKVCKGGNMFEAHIAEKTFRDMLAAEKNITLLERRRVVAARVIGSDGMERNATPGKRMDGAKPKEFGPTVKLVSITAEDLNKPGSRTEFRATTFIDCTYEGDLAALAGVPYRVGREGRGDFGEPHAGNIYLRFKDYNPLPGSTGAADDGIQAFCFRFHLTKDKANSVPIEKPPGFNRDDYQHLLDDIRAGKVKRLRDAIQLYEMPNDKWEVNSEHNVAGGDSPSESLDLAEENYAWPEASPEERARIFQRYWSHNEGLIWLLGNDPECPQELRDDVKQWGFPKDEFTDNRHRPHHIYVRQGRRIWGEYTLNQLDAKPVFETGLPRRQPDGISIVEFEFDSHGVTKFNPKYPGVREGYVFIGHDPFQIPYRAVVPKCVDGLLVPVACSATHIGYSALRMEPVFMALGEACGIAAMQAQSSGTTVRAVDVKLAQREIVKRGGVILYENTALVPEDL
ncbi:MAG: FAD-dependent oxidoreductase [Verrucomicrobiaceae bacterium]|nr:FAD-dependent oxidoreductase [Verrucomicrobiaceae bacterium]